MRSPPAPWESLARESGALERPLAASQWPIPAGITLDKDRLTWTRGREQLVRFAGGMLERFIGLADASGARILRYASRFGTLDLCEHGYPFRHPPDFGLPRVSPRPRRTKGRLRPLRSIPLHCEPLGAWEDRSWEPVGVWRLWARRAKAILDVAAELYEQRVARPELWRVVSWMEDMPIDAEWPQTPTDVTGAWHELAIVINNWIRLTPVRPVVEVSHGRLVLAIGGARLFGALAVLLTLAIARTDGLAVCSACAQSYIPKRRPRPDQRRYCPECRRQGVPTRDAMRDYRSQ